MRYLYIGYNGRLSLKKWRFEIFLIRSYADSLLKAIDLGEYTLVFEMYFNEIK